MNNKRLVAWLGLAMAVTSASGATPEAVLAEKVRRQLARISHYSVFDFLAFRLVEGNKVILLGQLARPAVARNAEDAVLRVEGIRRVSNEIEVLPLSRFDDEIRVRTARAIYGSFPLNRYAGNPLAPIRIVVKGGHVTLAGVVANPTERGIAELKANGVSGVFSVTNELRVERDR